MEAKITVLLRNRLSKILVYISLHEKKGEKGVFKNQISLRRAFRLNSIYRMIHVRWKAKITVLLCHRL